jgi:hypothetical protein
VRFAGCFGGGAALVFAVVLLASTSARADDPRWSFPAGSKATAMLAADKAHLYGVRLVEGTTYDVTLTGKKGFAPRLEFLDPARVPVATNGALTSTGAKTTLKHYVAARTGEYLLRVTGPTAGAYVLTSKATPSKGGATAASVVLVGDTSQFAFTATGGATATITVKPAKRSAALPLVVGVRDPQGADVPLDRRKTSPKFDACSVACAASGRYVVTFGAANSTVGDLSLVVKVITPRVKPTSLKIDASTRVPDFAWFAAKIQPIFQNRGCNATGCHGAVNGQGRMILRGPPSGPFSLEETYWNYFQLSRWVEVGNPQSRALLKPLYIEDGGIYHGGGDVFRKSDPEYQPFLDWVMGASLPSIPPIAHAGSDVHGYVGSVAQLDGSASSDVENQALSYQWSLLSAPGGSSAQLVLPGTARPTLTPDRSGVYLCRLVVVDTSGVASAPSQVAVAADANSQAGVITFEAENGAIAGGFAIGDDVAASNGHFISRPTGASQDGVASYLFSLDAAGDYAVWGRILATSNLHDAVRLRVDGGPIRTWEAPIAAGWKFSRANDGMNRRALVAGTSVLDPIGATNWFELKAESVDLRALAMTGARMQFGSIDAKVRFDTKLAGYQRNALVVFDWLDDRNYLFAGMNDNANLVYIGRVADGLRTNDASVAFTVNSNQNYQFHVGIDADGTVHALVDGTEGAMFRFDPAAGRGVNGGLVGMATERTTSSMSVGWFDDLVVTDSVEGVVWSDDFQTTPWTDPIVVTLDVGQHQLDVLAGETDVKLDRLVVAPATLDPSGAVGETRLVRRMYFDAANRSPTNDELILAPFLTTDGVADQLVNDYGYYQGWYEKRLVQFNLVGLNAPKTNDADYQSLSSIPARLTNAEITEIQALGEIAKSAAWARLNADSRDFTYSLFEEFLNRKPSTTTPAGGKSEYSAATNIYNATSNALFGETGVSPSDLVDIVLGLNGRHPNYNANLPGNLAPATQALFRGQIQLAWSRLVPTTPIASSDLSTWTAQYAADPTKIRATVATILKTDAYAQDAQTPRPKTPRQFIRGLYVDVLGRNPDLDTVGNLEYSFVSAGDPAPLAGQLVQQMLRSPDANAATPPVAGLDVDAWLDATFVRTFGRLPVATELAALKGAIQTAGATTDVELEAILTSQEYLYY